VNDTALERAEWLALRKATIGSSEAAAAIGVSAYQTPLELYYRKLGMLPEQAETLAMRLGTLMEPVLAALYEAETGEAVVWRQRWVLSEERPWMSATIDGAVHDPDGPTKLVEFKTANMRMRGEWGDTGTDEIPLAYLVQVQHQMIVTGLDQADVAVLIGNEDFRIYNIGRHERLCEQILKAESEFAACLRERRPPPERPDDGRTLARLAPRIEAEIDLAGNAEAVAWAAEYRALGPRIKEMQDAKEELKHRLIRSMAHHQSARLDDGTLLARKTVRRPEYVSKAVEYVDFRVKAPKTEE